MLCVTMMTAFHYVWCQILKDPCKGALFFAKISLNVFCCTVPSLLMHSAMCGDPWWNFGTSRGGNGEGRNLCRSYVWCLTLLEEPGGKECHQNSSWQLGDCGEYRQHLPLFCGCFAELKSIVQNLQVWEQQRRRICVFGVSQALIQPRLEGCHKFWSFSQTGMHMDWQCDWLWRGRCLCFGSRAVRVVERHFTTLGGLWWFSLDTCGKTMKSKGEQEWDSTCKSLG